jgi:purine-nucleoside phosphorylase
MITPDMTLIDPISFEKTLDAATKLLLEHGLGADIDCAFVLGTGLGGIAKDVEDTVIIPYDSIPGFPVGNVSGHQKQLCYGMMEGKRVLIFQGRSHFYEAGNANAMRAPMALLTRLGSPPLVLTNAAGSTRAKVTPGALVMITDHINYAGTNPLIGDVGDARFISMTNAYDPNLRQALQKAAALSDIQLHEGVYMWFSGPSFETPAEVRMAHIMGADLVGMSTVPEVILARRYGLRVAAISTVTNLAAGIMGASPSHGETQDVAQGAATGLRKLIRTFVASLNTTGPEHAGL